MAHLLDFSRNIGGSNPHRIHQLNPTHSQSPSVHYHPVFGDLSEWNSFTQSVTQLLSHSPTHSLLRSPTSSLTRSPARFYPLTHSLTGSSISAPTHPFTCSLSPTRSLSCLLTTTAVTSSLDSLTHPHTNAQVRSLTRSVVLSPLTHSLVLLCHYSSPLARSYIPSFTHTQT